MSQNAIRPIAICLFRHYYHILVFEGFDGVKQQSFFRPLGGGIEFGETSRQTIRREIREELSEEVVELNYLATLENIFVYQGQTGHEIVQVYDGRFANEALYSRDELEGVEDNGVSFRAIWKPIDDFVRKGAPPLYPDGLLELVVGGSQSRGSRR